MCLNVTNSIILQHVRRHLSRASGKWICKMCSYQQFSMSQQHSLSTNVANAKHMLVAFDFDHTIVDQNTDGVARSLVPKNALQSAEEVYKSTDSWTLYMEEIFRILHKLNISKSQIIEAIRSIPAIKDMDALLKYLSANNFEVIIISDSNSVFIEEWIKYSKFENVIKKVFTNPAWFDDNGLLNIKFYHHQSFCKLSEPNLCKGFVLQTYIEDRKVEGLTFDHVLYIGDGINDFCPTIKLNENDLVFPRLNYALSNRIKEKRNMVKAEVHPWKDGSDIIRVLQEKFPMLKS